MPPPSQGEPPPSPVATLSLVSSPASITPGERTWIGAHLKIAPGWHVYGKDPGDAGMPTRIRLEAPPGFTVGDVVYPPAKRFVDAGDIVTHGYERETLLLIPVDAPHELPSSGTMEFRARGSWLACRDLCVKESGEAVLGLPVGAPQAPPAEIAALLARYPLPRQPEPRP